LEQVLDITNCDKEPIHIPGAVQSHGFLIAINRQSGLISYLSQNVQSITGIDAKNFLQKDPAILADEVHLESLEARFFLMTLGEKLRKGGTFDYLNPILIQIKAITYNLIYHLSGDELIVEIEPEGVNQLQLLDVIGDIISQTSRVSNLDTLLNTAAREIKQIIKYDRVMIYKFAPEGHGQVVAEEKNEDLNSFLGLWYPASDIPKQARELYKLNPTRLIVDVDTVTAPIITSASNKQPLDLTYSQLRAVSPMHIEYLKNMGVKSSFSISLISKGELWGLIACHNYSPKFINYQARETSKLIGQIIYSSLEFVLEEEDHQVIHSINENLIILQSHIEKEDMIDALSKNSVSLLNITNATGAVIIFDNKISSFGETPSIHEIKNIADWLIEHSHNDIYFTNLFPAMYAPAVQYSHIASGILCCIFSIELKEMIIWFKPEQIQQVTWAGNPEKPIERDDNGNSDLMPRKSFEKWTEIVKHTAQQWTSAEVSAVEKIREHLIYAIKRKADDIRILNEKLSLANEELDAFSFTVSHDLKIPLAAIKGYAQLLEMSDDFSLPDQKIILGKIIKASNRMDLMMNEILRYSQVGKEAYKNEMINMKALLDEITSEIFSQNQYQGVEMAFGEITNFTGDQVMISQLFSNLLSNAVKYSSKSERPKVIIESEVKNNEVIYSITDNGIGIDTRYHSRVFELFKRMDNVDDIDGSGVGLTIAKRIVEKHNGKIWFESDFGKGTTFYVLFPKGN
jgi:light-regulated signal transduction histidine kinase (bacteriophytochrome)